jgi:hypothetical protein
MLDKEPAMQGGTWNTNGPESNSDQNAEACVLGYWLVRVTFEIAPPGGPKDA